MARDFTNAELRQIAGLVARRYLEVERGLRSRQSLRRFLSPEAYNRQVIGNPSRFGNAGIVRQDDLGQMVFQRPRPDRVHIAIPARQDRDRWGALVMELGRDARGAWRVTELIRAQDRDLWRQQSVDRHPPTDRQAAAPGQGQTAFLASAARTAAQRRVADAQRNLAALAPEKPAAEVRPGEHVWIDRGRDQHWFEVAQVHNENRRGTIRLLGTDGRRETVPADQPLRALTASPLAVEVAKAAADRALGQLAHAAQELVRWDRELIELDRARDLHSKPLPPLGQPNEGTLRPLPPPYVTRLLGDPPTDQQSRRRWNAAVDAVEAYRDRWGIDSTDSALGPFPDQAAQRTDRQLTVDVLRKLTEGLEFLAAGDRGHGHDLARHDRTDDPFAPRLAAQP